MSIAIEFEKALLSKLDDASKEKFAEIIEDEQVTNQRLSKDTTKHEKSSPELTHESKVFPHAATLFLGMCIGVGLASHSLILQWK